MFEESLLGQVKRLLVGRPIPSDRAHHERLSKATGLAVLSSDALSSVAYATEEVLRVLMVGGLAAMTWSPTESEFIEALTALPPDSATAPPKVAPSIKNCTVPLGVPPPVCGETVAVKVIDCPATLGLPLVVTTDVVSALLTVCVMFEATLALKMLSPL